MSRKFISLKSDKNSGNFTWRFFKQKLSRKSKHILCSVTFFRKSYRLRRQKIRWSQRCHKWRYNMAHTSCMLDKQGYMHARICTRPRARTHTCPHAHTHKLRNISNGNVTQRYVIQHCLFCCNRDGAFTGRYKLTVKCSCGTGEDLKRVETGTAHIAAHGRVQTD
jgi:hypothetical protein